MTETRREVTVRMGDRGFGVGAAGGGLVVLAVCRARFAKLVADLERAGFARIQGGKGSHRKFVHPKFPGFVLISGHDGNDAQHYQEKQLRNALRTVQS